MKLISKSYFCGFSNYVQSIMKDISGKRGPFLFNFLLLLLSVIYGGMVKLRSDLFDKGVLRSNFFPCMTISIGNLTAGGTGKTPFSIYTANVMKRYGLSVVVVSRGYGGALEKRRGCVVSDGVTCFEAVHDAGDEAYLIAHLLKNIPVVVGCDRFKAGMKAIKTFNPDVMIFDDAFQHLKIRCDLNLVLMDNSFPLGNGCMLPRGILREPASALQRADAIIFTRNIGRKFNLQCPSFSCSHRMVLRKIVSTPRIDYRLDFGGKAVIAVSGLADNAQFHRAVIRLNFFLKGKIGFSDHHEYNSKDMEKILIMVRQTEAQFIVTTDKDYVKLADVFSLPVPILVFGVDIEFGDDKSNFNKFISKFVCKFGEVGAN